MDRLQFESVLDGVAEELTNGMRNPECPEWCSGPLAFEQHARLSIHNAVGRLLSEGEENPVDLEAVGQTFPDIACGRYGVEVKFTKADSWVSIANSIREARRDESVEVVYLLFGKMGGIPECRWKRYEDCIVHVRTSHEPRFQVDMTGSKPSLFKVMGITYEEFRKLDIMDKMPYIRNYAMLKHPEGRLWWIEDTIIHEEHSTEIEPILYTDLDELTKAKYRAEVTLLCPEVLQGGRVRGKYSNAVLFLLTYHGVLCYQARDLFTAGSVARVQKSNHSGEPQIKRALIYLQEEMLAAARYLDPGLFKEYWGVDVPVDERIEWWLRRADQYATGWVPSKVLFLDYRKTGPSSGGRSE